MNQFDVLCHLTLMNVSGSLPLGAQQLIWEAPLSIYAVMGMDHSAGIQYLPNTSSRDRHASLMMAFDILHVTNPPLEWCPKERTWLWNLSFFEKGLDHSYCHCIESRRSRIYIMKTPCCTMHFETAGCDLNTTFKESNKICLIAYVVYHT